MAREWRPDEVRDEFLQHVHSLTRYWETVRPSDHREYTVRDRLEGLAFSIMTALDGCSHLPGFIVAPCPHESDKPYHEQEGSNWYPENLDCNVVCDIGGGLHEHLVKHQKKEEK